MGYGLARASQGNSTSNRYRDSGSHGGTPAAPDVIGQQSVPTVQAQMSCPEAVALAQAIAPEETRANKARILLKLLPYSGEGSLETFLAKFEYMAKYLGWSRADRFHHLCASLEGAAGQVLWGLKSDATADSVISVLRT